MSFCKKCESFLSRDVFCDFGLLILRLSFGGSMFFLHGLGKFQSFSELSEKFPDPLHIGNPMISLVLALSGEFLGCGLLVLGLWTRFAAIPAAITMGVATFVIHASDPWEKKELAFLYFGAFLALFLLGAGRFSLDYFRLKKS